MAARELRQAYESWKVEATRLAGGLTDLAQRATVYHHVYQDSGGNHVFPLIAAHGALWARGYFRFGLGLGKLLAAQYALSSKRRREQLRHLHEFADVFRDINRRVCIDIYTNYRFTKQFGADPAVAEIIPQELLEPLCRVHAARKVGRALSDIERWAVFEAHFLHEQATVVGPTLADAVARFPWRLAKFVALRPLVHFAYFPLGQFLWFGDFSNTEERIQRGREAFDIAARVGWEKVEAALRHYDVLPEAFFADSRQHFETTRLAILATV